MSNNLMIIFKIYYIDNLKNVIIIIMFHLLHFNYNISIINKYVLQVHYLLII